MSVIPKHIWCRHLASNRGNISTTSTESNVSTNNGRNSGDGEDALALPMDRGDSSSSLPILDGKDYVAFDLAWTDHGTNNNPTIYAAAFSRQPWKQQGITSIRLFNAPHRVMA